MHCLTQLNSSELVAKSGCYKFQVPDVFTREVIMLQVAEMLSQESTDFGNTLSKVIT